MTEVFYPLGDRVLVRPVKTKPREVSPLDLGEIQEPQQVLRAEVVAAGGLSLRIDFDVVKVIAYAPYSGKEIKLNGEVLIILTEEEILGFFKGEE